MIIILGLAKLSSHDAILSPQVAYVIGFIPSLFYLIFYINKWSVELSSETIKILLFGAGWFVIVSAFFSLIFNKYSLGFKKQLLLVDTINDHADSVIHIDTWKMILVDAMGVIAVILLMLEIRRNYGAPTIGQMLYEFRESYSSGYVDIPTIVSLLRMETIASGYMAIYILVNNWAQKARRKGDVFLIINVCICIISELLFGARGELLTNIVAFFVVYIFVTNKIYSFKLNYKYIILGFIALVLFWQSFQMLGKALGRIELFDNRDYIAIYLSAPIKNFDTFIRSGNINHNGGLHSSRTLFHLVNYYYVRYGDINNYYSVRGIFKYVNGYSLGNCYTTYYAYLYDGGMKALIIYETLMAFICQAVFYKAIRKMKRCDGRININVIIYSLLFFNVLLSFFSSNFYYNCFEIGFIRTIIIIYLLDFFYFRVKFVF